MSAVKFETLAGKTVGELYDACHERKKELLGLRMQKQTEQLQNTSQIRKNRREVAQLLTRINQLKNEKNKG